MSEAEIAAVLSDVLRQLGSGAGDKVASAGDIVAIISVFAAGLAVVLPIVSAEIAFDPVYGPQEIAPLFDQAGIVMPQDFGTSDGYAMLELLGTAAAQQGYAMIYLDLGTEDSPIFLVPQSIGDQLLALRSQELAEAMNLPPGPPAKLVQQIGTP